MLMRLLSVMGQKGIMRAGSTPDPGKPSETGVCVCKSLFFTCLRKTTKRHLLMLIIKRGLGDGNITFAYWLE